jgi:hypothetical protein
MVQNDELKLVDLLVLTRDYLEKVGKEGGSANLQGDTVDLAQYLTINFTYIFFSIFSKPISESHYIMAGLTRSVQEQIADFYYVVNHKNKNKVNQYFERIRFGEHRHIEYFEAMQCRYSCTPDHRPPKWTKSTQTGRIRSQLGEEEEIFSGLLCAYTHFAAGNHRFTVHKGEIVLIRRYLVTKLVKYTFLLAELRKKQKIFKNSKSENLTTKYLEKASSIVGDWDEYLRSQYEMADLSNEHTDSEESQIIDKEHRTSK